LRVDVLVDVDALDRETDLARVEEGEGSDLLGGRVDVDIFADNGGVIAAARKVC
jgi:hypothetical protein